MTMTNMLREIREQADVLRGLLQANRKTLTDLCRALRERAVTHAVFAARGTSDHAGIFAQYLLGITRGTVCALAQPSCITLYGGRLSFENDLVVGISQSGRAADALAVLEQANQAGGITLAVTNDPDSPMAKAAQYHLCCNAGPELSVAATKTFTAQLGLILLLTAYWNGDETLLSHFAALPAFIDQVNARCDSEIEALTRGYRTIEDGFVLSRGLTYPIACETMLKIQETCYVKMKGYAVSDFYHGPLAQVDKEDTVLLFAPSGRALPDHRAMFQKLREIGINPLTVTSDPALAQECAPSFLLPDTGCELTQPLLFAVFAQRFAESLCAQKGLDPDAPRNLKKVTITR